jgi:hypothetical protein
MTLTIVNKCVHCDKPVYGHIFCKKCVDDFRYRITKGVFEECHS